jgi:hypothetical protein
MDQPQLATSRSSGLNRARVMQQGTPRRESGPSSLARTPFAEIAVFLCFTKETTHRVPLVHLSKQSGGSGIPPFLRGGGL